MLRNRLVKKNTSVDIPSVAPTVTVVVRRSVPVKRRWSERVLGGAVLLLVPGFLLASSIPALAAGGNPFGDDTEVVLADPVDARAGQTLAANVSAAPIVTRGEFTADTHAQIVARRAATARAGAYSTVTPQQEGDDYPWRASGGGLSVLGYVTRQCTDFVAWRLNRDAGTYGPYKYVWANLTPNGGSASRWASAWNQHGWQTSNSPVPGAVAWFNGNHIAYVKAVNGDGTIFIEEYNWGGNAAYNSRTISASSVGLFLYPPP